MRYQALVPLVTYPDANGETAVTNAMDLAKLIEATIDVVVMEPLIPEVGNALSHVVLNLPEQIRAVYSRCADIAAELIRTVDQHGDREQLMAHASSLKLNPVLMGERAAEIARCYDLSIVGWAPQNAGIHALTESLLFGSGRPVVLVPESAKLQQLEHIAVAWDGTRAASRAVADGRRFLKRSSRVSVITVAGEKPIRDQDRGEIFAESLRRAGLEARFFSTSMDGRSISETLQNQAVSLGADLLIMGGFGHSRIRNFVLGSATRGVMHQLAMPVLLSH